MPSWTSTHRRPWSWSRSQRRGRHCPPGRGRVGAGPRRGKPGGGVPTRARPRRPRPSPARADGAVEETVTALLDAVDVEAWQQTAGQLLTAASQAENLLPHAGGQRTGLETAMRAAGERVEEAAAGVADQLRRLSSFVPEQDRVAEMQAVIEAMASVTELEDVIRRVAAAVSDTATGRAAALLDLAPHAGRL